MYTYIHTYIYIYIYFSRALSRCRTSRRTSRRGPVAAGGEAIRIIIIYNNKLIIYV